ncbi:hypothetical protein, partial [Roseateles puraquae]|uniref:hypothetical protein n=1 Tax=Roseateles puraquae TaxID=431059 RepID=UPI0024084847
MKGLVLPASGLLLLMAGAAYLLQPAPSAPQAAQPPAAPVALALPPAAVPAPAGPPGVPMPATAGKLFLSGGAYDDANVDLFVNGLRKATGRDANFTPNLA